MTREEMMAAEVERTLLKIMTEEDLIKLIPELLETVSELVEKIAEARGFNTKVLDEVLMFAHMYGSCVSAYNIDISPKQFVDVSRDGYTAFLELQMGEPHGNA